MKLSRIFSEETYFEDKKFRIDRSTVEIHTLDDQVHLEIHSLVDKLTNPDGWKIISDRKLCLAFKDINQIQILSETINRWLATDPETSIQRVLPGASGIFSNRICEPHRKELNSNQDSLVVEVESDRIELRLQSSSHISAYIPVSTEKRNSKEQNNHNIKNLYKLLEKFITYYELETYAEELPVLFDDNQLDKMSSSKYGKEVITHLKEGDKCFTLDMYIPALSSYVHAIEWSIISYLESEKNIDIIQKEKENGNPYYFSDLLGTLTSNSPIDQKSISRLEKINSAERRWMAHHKEGPTRFKDVKRVREDLGELLQMLYS
ncbi:hypothetical protein C453_04004 [Haloferax elongans ATCC BAA-1513]|uniref:Uncharacterized protein n=1 Tax=Haloferax elongans ATCC BAA-1513 TaxID=1230453 RepID=M0HSB3_HALEO|nr:hypothetical protein [Haloferax elongans]ELZ87485.1 hypothetical protein C453_04004 [Haloferax elongans ATCC BAA-1513]